MNRLTSLAAGALASAMGGDLAHAISIERAEALVIGQPWSTS